jgi:pyoverdine/dityrosine biosynthesis protein Dit1
MFIWASLVSASINEHLYPTARKSAICKVQAPTVAFTNKYLNKIEQLLVSKYQGESFILPAFQVSANQGEKKFVSRPIPAITNKSPPTAC